MIGGDPLLGIAGGIFLKIIMHNLIAVVDTKPTQPKSWLDQWPAIMMAISAVVQGITAIIIVCLTRRLVRGTDTYALLTKAALDLNTKQYEGDVSPMWHLTLVPAGTNDNEVWLKVSNLSKNSAIVTYLLIRAESEGESEPRKFLLDVGLPGLREHISNVRQFIVETVGAHLVDGEWTGVLEVAVAFTLTDSAAQLPSPPFRFKMTIREGRITSAQARLAGISVEPRRENSQ